MAQPVQPRALNRTPLHDVHVRLGAKMVPFGGYEMPVSYAAKGRAGGIAAEHRAVREAVGVFDVSHMGEFEITGPDRNAFVQRATCNDVGALTSGQAQYSAILTERGTIVDDCLVYRFEDRLMMVVNAANIDKDWEHIVAQKRGANVRLRNISPETGLLALQGPRAEAVLAPLASAEVKTIRYYHFAEGKVAGVQCFISRTGYTGEDGFELYCRARDVEQLWRALVEQAGAEPCGLAARDTLRLEAGYPLYGSDIDDTVTPYEAGLGWIVKLEKGADFTGLAALKRQKLEGVRRRLVGFKVTEPKLVARHGYDVYVDGRKADIVRSGTVTPTTSCAIGITYLPVERAKPGTPFEIDVRGKRAPAEVVRLPFVPHRTRRTGEPADRRTG
jgi:aminomethyltransferase